MNMPIPENVVDALVGEAFNHLHSNAQKVMQALAIFNRRVPSVAISLPCFKPYVDGVNEPANSTKISQYALCQGGKLASFIFTL